MADWQPQGRSTVSPYIMVKDAEKVLNFAKQVFDAKEITPALRHGDGTIWNAEITIGDASVMLAEAPGEMSMPAWLYVYVSDVDSVFQKALDAGASVMMPVEDQFYGDRAGGVTDSQGNIWWIATHKDDLSHDGMQRRADEVERQRSG